MRQTRATPDRDQLDYMRTKLYQGLFNTDTGQKVLKDICERLCKVTSSPFASDPHGTAYNVGKQDVARELLRLCNPQLDPKKPNVIMDTPHDFGS